MKQPLAYFGVTLGVTLGLGGLMNLLPYICKMILLPDNSTAYFSSYSIATSLLVPIYCVLSFFAFYQFGKKVRVFSADKATILALFFGLLIGNTITTVFASSGNLPFEVYASLIASYSFASAFQWFFPPLAGLLYAEFSERKHSQKLAAESAKQKVSISPPVSPSNLQ